MTSEPHTTIRSVTDRPDVDTLAASITNYVTGAVLRTPELQRKVVAEVSDLAARARDEAMARETGKAYDRGFENGIAENKRSREAAEAVRDEKVMQMGHLEIEYEQLAEERDRLLLLVQGGNCIRDDSGESPCERLARRVTELEQENERTHAAWDEDVARLIAARRVTELEAAPAPPDMAIRRLLDAYHGDHPESVEVAIAAQKVEAWLAGDGGGADENLAARVQEAKRILAEGDQADAIAYLLNRPVEDVRRVSAGDGGGA